MIEKEDIVKSLDFFKDIELENGDIGTIYDNFKKILNDPEVNEVLVDKMSFLNSKSEQENIRSLMEILISKLDLKDLNVLLNKIIKDESLSDFLQDFFLEKLI